MTKPLSIAVIGLTLLVACAGGKQEQKQTQAKAEIVGEEPAKQPAPGAQAPAGAPAQQPAAAAAANPADPFSSCSAKPVQQGVAAIECGQVVGVIARVTKPLDERGVEANFAAFQKQFPPDAKAERYTREIGGVTGTGLKVSDATGSPFRAAILIVPLSPKNTRVVSCVNRGSTDWERCQKIVGTLAEEGIPAALPGADQVPDSLRAAAQTGGAAGTGASATGSTSSGTGTSGSMTTGAGTGSTTGTGTTGTTGAGTTGSPGTGTTAGTGTATGTATTGTAPIHR